jgi:hypothetical protein
MDIMARVFILLAATILGDIFPMPKNALKRQVAKLYSKGLYAQS